ncbi:MAG TPA: hypothetical protein VNV41_20845 [Candidatus Acidoferrales bacterium]|nr:hypothetical protein [Candidatus Acidoferrales bacterium]
MTNTRGSNEGTSPDPVAGFEAIVWLGGAIVPEGGASIEWYNSAP